MKLKPAYITIEDEDGNIIERIPMTAADDDWIRAHPYAETPQVSASLFQPITSAFINR